MRKTALQPDGLRKHSEPEPKHGLVRFPQYQPRQRVQATVWARYYQASLCRVELYDGYEPPTPNCVLE